jgi:hypothetical protein
MTGFWFSPEGAAAVDSALPPQAARDRSIRRESRIANVFFIDVSSLFYCAL